MDSSLFSHQEVVEQIGKAATYLGNNMVKVDGLLNHHCPPKFMNSVGHIFYQLFADSFVSSPTKIVTAEASGIAPAFALAMRFDIPFVYARKSKPGTMSKDTLVTKVMSRTKSNETDLYIAKEYISSDDQVLLIDDFLGSGTVTLGLVDLINQSGAKLVGIGVVVEKVFEKGRERLAELGVPVVSVAKLDLKGQDLLVSD